MGGRHRISDSEWETIRKYVEKEKGGRGRSRADARNIVDAIMWVMKTGAAWRDIPEAEYGKWKTAYNNFLRWRDCGKWEEILADIIEKSEADSGDKNDTYIIDSTTSKLHFDGSGAKKGSENHIGRSKGGSRQRFTQSVTGKDDRCDLS